MDSEKCTALLKILECGSLSAAAARLGYTPSGISRLVEGMEREAGCALLVRARSGVRLTREGELLLPAIREMAYQGERYQQLIQQIHGLETGTVVAGTAYTACYPWLAEIVAGFHRLYPYIRVELMEGTSTQLARSVDERRADFCLISRREGSHRWQPLLDDQLMALVPGDHPLAGHGSFPILSFQTEPFIDILPGLESDNSRFFAQYGIHPPVRFATGDTRAACALIRAGLGISLANSIITTGLGIPAAGESGHPAEKLLALPLDPPQRVSVGAALPEEDRISPAARRFTDYALSRAKELPAMI